MQVWLAMILDYGFPFLNYGNVMDIHNAIMADMHKLITEIHYSVMDIDGS